jgi:hypothetical protein
LILAPLVLVLFFQNCGKSFEVQNASVTEEESSLSFAGISTSLDPVINQKSISVQIFFDKEQPNRSSVFFACKLDKMTDVECKNGQLIINDLQDGVHSLEVYAFNGGVRSESEFVPFVVDTKAPQIVISEAPPAQTGNASPVIKFMALDEGTGVKNSECSIDGGAFSICESPLSLKGLSDQRHEIKIKSTDKAKNQSEIATVAFVVDTNAPVINISQRPAEITNSKDTKIVFTGMDNGVSISDFECAIDGAAFTSCTSPVSFTVTDGLKSFAVRGLDQLKHMSEPLEIKWIVDTTAPLLPVIASNIKTVDSATAVDFTFSANDQNGSGILSYECQIDSAAFATCSSPKQLVGLGQGAHTFKVRALDKASNQSAVAEYKWTVDSVPPTDPVITTVSRFPTTFNSHTFSFTSADTGTGVTKFECVFDNLPSAACVSPFNLSNLGIGSHSLTVYAFDGAGNRNGSAFSFEIREFLTPDDFGAAGDGVTNDTVAVQTALKLGKTVVFPKNKTYLVDGDLMVTLRNQNLLGKGGKILKSPGIAKNIFVLQDNIDGVTFDHMDINGSRDSFPSFPAPDSVASAIFGMLTTNLTVKGCYFHDIANSGIKLFDSAGLVADGNVFYNINSDGIELKNYDFTYGTARPAVEGNHVIKNNLFSRIDDHKRGAGDGCGILWAGTEKHNMVNVKVTGNTFRDVINGVWSENNELGGGSFDILIANNIFGGSYEGSSTVQTKNGIGMISAQRVTIVNNVAHNLCNFETRDMNADGKVDASFYLDIIKNGKEDVGERDQLENNCAFIVISGNPGASNDFVVSGNRFTDTATGPYKTNYFAYIKVGARINIFDNYSSGTTGEAIRIEPTTERFVSGVTENNNSWLTGYNSAQTVPDYDWTTLVNGFNPPAPPP